MELFDIDSHNEKFRNFADEKGFKPDRMGMIPYLALHEIFLAETYLVSDVPKFYGRNLETFAEYDRFVSRERLLGREEHQLWKLLKKCCNSLLSDNSSPNDREWALVTWNQLGNDMVSVERKVELAYQP